jgi:D-arabinose 1-dehydrogenase-like Zn-dependent alcohol dehydrogenase
MKRNKEQKVNKDYKIISFIIITIAFFAIFAVRPSLAMILTLTKEKKEYEEVNQVLEEKIQQIIQAQSKYMTVLNKKSLIDEAMPDEPKIEDTAKILEQNINLNMFGIKDFSIIPPKNLGLNSVSINLNGSGTYSDTIELLNTIANSRRVFVYKNMTIQKHEISTSSALLDLTTNIETYYYVR